jgi:hypothetical protein
MFDIPGWENRIYAYENDFLYSFSVPAFSSVGTRFIIMGRSELYPGIELSIRYAVSEFSGIRTWGNGEDKVNSSKDPYFSFQIRVKL